MKVKAFKFTKNHEFHGNTEMGVFQGRMPISWKMSQPWNRELGWCLSMGPSSEIVQCISRQGHAIHFSNFWPLSYRGTDEGKHFKFGGPLQICASER